MTLFLHFKYKYFRRLIIRNLLIFGSVTSKRLETPIPEVFWDATVDGSLLAKVKKKKKSPLPYGILVCKHGSDPCFNVGPLITCFIVCASLITLLNKLHDFRNHVIASPTN